MFRLNKKNNKKATLLGGIMREISGAPQVAELKDIILKEMDDYNSLFQKLDDELIDLIDLCYDDSMFESDDAKKDNVFNKQYRKLKKIIEAANTRGDYKTVESINDGSYELSFQKPLYNVARNKMLNVSKLEDLEMVVKDNLVFYITSGKLIQNAETLKIIAYIEFLKSIQSKNKNRIGFKNIQDTDYRFYVSIEHANNVIELEKNKMRYSSDYLYEKHIDKIITDARIRRKMG